MANDDVLWPLLFGQLSDGVCISSPSDSILYMNPAAERMMGVSAEKADGQPLCSQLCGQLHKPDESDCATGCPLRLADSEQKSITFRGAYGAKESADRKMFRVRCLSLNTQIVDSRKSARNMTIIEDVSAEKELERQKEDWRNMIAHDLRAPLTSIWGTLRILQDQSEGHQITADEKRLVDAGVRSCRRTVELLNLYLDIIKLEAGMMPVRKTMISIAPIVAQSVEQQRVLAASAGVTIESSVENADQIFADEALLPRILDNLINNAIKFTPAGGHIQITSSRDAAGSVRISIKDSGPGIPQDDLPRIFDRFYQSHARQQGKFHGTGLGLTFCREAVQAMGGRIEVESAPGQGSTFTVILPSS